MSDLDTRRSIELLQGLHTLAVNQVLTNRLGSSITLPIATTDGDPTNESFDQLFGKAVPKNSPAPALPGSSAGVTTAPESLAVVTDPSSKSAEGGISTSQDAGSNSTDPR